MTYRVNRRIIKNSFSTMRSKADYCTGLAEMAEEMVASRRRSTLQAAMTRWRDRHDVILAARCYGHFLVVRVARQWRKFVQRRKEQRQMDLDQWNSAVKCHQRSLW